ncbi:probable hexosyltransferase MUCI70 [Cornus florida]|uniref:probable hexosyltransferase MUCI70 n=1 Tax=Cornus florida TaxID=4283 RepID=UPI00289DB6C7|nr:probable hexosyltransferase MUCI70 [Cornus florida]
MTGGSLGLRTGSYGSLQQLNGVLRTQNSFTLRKSPKMCLFGSRVKERFLAFTYRYLGKRKVGMLVLVVFALLAFMTGFFFLKEEESESTSSNIAQNIQNTSPFLRTEGAKDNNSSLLNHMKVCAENKGHPSSPTTPYVSAAAVVIGSSIPLGDQCKNFAFPPPPPGPSRRIGPRPCPVCYLPIEQAISSMPSSQSVSPVLRHLTYFLEENPTKTESHGGSDFGGYPSLGQRNDSFIIKESMTVHCGFVKGCRPGQHTGFNIDEADLGELEQFHDVIVASAIFGNYDIIHQPQNISEFARKNIPFYMFIDEETETHMKNSSVLDGSKRVGLWRVIVVYNTPYTDSRRNGKVPKLLLHRLFPNVRYSIWIDGKLQLVVDPYQVLERFLWRQNASFAISRHYRRFDVFVEAEANKAAGKYYNASIDYQIDFYKKEGLTPYSETKLPITSDVPEGCVIIREHIPITNLFTCLWFNEVDRFTSRDQLSFSTVRDKIMAKVNWSINMFMDCERRNFVIQAYHRDLLEHMTPPPGALVHPQPASLIDNKARRNPVKKNPTKRGKGNRRSGSRRHRKVIVGKRDIPI